MVSNSYFSIINIFNSSGLLSKIIILFLIFVSLWSWTVIFFKIFYFKTIRAKIKSFKKIFYSKENFKQVYDSIKNRERDPLSLIFVVAVKEFNAVISGNENSFDSLKEQVFRKKIFAVNQSITIVLNKLIEEMREYIPALGSIASFAPFVGLLGTVLGIINSFYSVSLQSAVNISVIAPGISEALLVTAIGLFVAVPALVFYNYFSSVLNNLSVELEGFSREICLKLVRKV